MEGFDTSTMTYIGPAMPMGNGADQNVFTKPNHLNVDVHDMYSNFDISTFAGSDDFAFHGMPQHQMPPRSQPQLSSSGKHMPNTFDEPAYSDVVSHFETQTNAEVQEPETSIDRDNKLLSFSPLTFNHILLDYSFQTISVTLAAQLHGMFFLAESSWTPNGDTAVPPPSELTCYRRNLFQITGSINVPRTLRCIMSDAGEQIPIVSQELTVSATESTEGNPVKIISVPWKTPVNPAQTAVPEDKSEKEPPSIPIDLLNATEGDAGFVQIPIQWRRLQFRIATANNGRRKELQQHFVIRLKLMATLADGSKVSLCESRSGPVIVRGRSPRNFQSRKDTPLNGSASHARKSITSNPVPQQQRTASSDVVNRTPTGAVPPPKAETFAPAPSVQSYFDPADFTGHGQEGLYDSMLPPNMTTGHGAVTAIPQEPFSLERHRGGYAASSPDLARNPNSKGSPVTPSAPIQLSLVDEDPISSQQPPLKRLATDGLRRPSPLQRQNSGSAGAGTPSGQLAPSSGAMKKPQMASMRPPSFSINTVSTPDESADLLYEYFPLGIDDWMPPVDAVYRPHVVHHIKVNADPRNPAVGSIRGRNKRYFSEVAG